MEIYEFIKIAKNYGYRFKECFMNTLIFMNERKKIISIDLDNHNCWVTTPERYNEVFTLNDLKMISEIYKIHNWIN